MFVGRKRELEKLNKMYDSSRFEFAVVYGRRRRFIKSAIPIGGCWTLVEQEALERIIKKVRWMDFETFSAYYVCEGKCKSCLDTEFEAIYIVL